MIQKTRQKILEYLKENSEATVDELSQALDNLTAVTVRHHLDVLRSQGLVAPPIVRHRNTPGRPKYVYCLTEKAEDVFPKNLQLLTGHLLSEMKSTLDKRQVESILNGVAERMAANAPVGRSGEPLKDRLDRTVSYLNDHGYVARWEPDTDGYVIFAGNCPYGSVTENHREICVMDMGFITRLLGTTPHRLTHRAEGDNVCSYLVPNTESRKTH